MAWFGLLEAVKSLVKNMPEEDLEGERFSSHCFGNCCYAALAVLELTA